MVALFPLAHKVDIQVKVVEDGSSLKKIVVEEAKKTKASKVILGYAYGKAHSRYLRGFRAY